MDRWTNVTIRFNPEWLNDPRIPGFKPEFLNIVRQISDFCAHAGVFTDCEKLLWNPYAQIPPDLDLAGKTDPVFYLRGGKIWLLRGQNLTAAFRNL